MISVKDIIQAGITQKPYGVRGELVILFSREEYGEVESECYFLMIDGIPVPFFVEEFTQITNLSARVKFEDVNDLEEASKYVNLDVYLSRSIFSAESHEGSESWHLFVGYDVIDKQGEVLGTITNVDDSTLNVLFILLRDEEELMIPATEDFITAIDRDNKVIEMNLPEGLFDN